MAEDKTPNGSEADKPATQAEASPEASKAEVKEQPEAKKKPAATPAAKADKPAAASAAKADKPPAKAKKEKPPAPEDKPFPEFITQEFIPNLTKTLANQGISDLELKFGKQPLPIPGLQQNSDCWQVTGNWQNGKRQFLLAFAKEDITGPKFYAAADNGSHPTTLESFMIDERKVTLDLMVFYVVQRLNGQKWLARN